MFRWRDVIAVHQAAELFPLLSASELQILAEDIRARGLLTKPVLWSPPDPDDKYEALIDGRNRLDALALAGLLGLDEGGYLAIKHNDGGLRRISFQHADRAADPYNLTISLNIHRRHLDAEQRRDLIAKLLKAKPETSNLQIAKQVKADDKTVATVRTELEARSEIPNVAERTDTKGRKQPASKPRPEKVSRKRRNREEICLDNFAHAVEFAACICETLKDAKLPERLTAAQANKVVQQLEDAERCLREVKSKISALRSSGFDIKKSAIKNASDAGAAA